MKEQHALTLVDEKATLAPESPQEQLNEQVALTLMDLVLAVTISLVSLVFAGWKSKSTHHEWPSKLQMFSLEEVFLLSLYGVTTVQDDM